MLKKSKLGVIPLFFASLGTLHANTTKIITTAPVSDVFIPYGYDDNDDISIVLRGSMPNNCYRLTQPKIVPPTESNKVIEVEARAKKFDPPCAPVVVPFSQTVYIGSDFAAGDYKVKIVETQSNGSKKTVDEQILVIQKAKFNRPDENDYAQVEAVQLSSSYDQTDGSTRYLAKLSVLLTSSCQELQDKPEIIAPYKNNRVYTVLPIVKIKTDKDCKSINERKTKTVNFAINLHEGFYLLHVRSNEGQAFNTVFSSFTAGVSKNQ